MEIISVLVIVPGAYTQESQNVQKLTHVPLAIAILLVVFLTNSDGQKLTKKFITNSLIYLF